MINDVYLKDLPYEFLKDKSSDFFSSNEFKNHVELFNQFKQTDTNDNSSTPSNITKFITFLQYLISNKYNDEEIEFKNDDDKLAWIYISSQVLLTNKYKYAPLPNFKVITNNTNNLHSPSNIIRRKIRSDNFNNFKMYVDNNDLLPEDITTSTNNPIADIISESIKLQNYPSEVIYDSVKFRKHKENLLRYISNDVNIDPNIEFKYVNTAKNIITDYFNYNDLMETIDFVRKLISDKYITGISNSKYNLNTVDNASNLITSLKYTISRKVFSADFTINLFTSDVPKITHIFTLPKDSDNYLFNVIFLDTLNNYNATITRSGVNLTVETSVESRIKLVYFHYNDFSEITINNIITNNLIHKYEIDLYNVQSFKLAKGELDEGFICIGQTMGKIVNSTYSVLNDNYVDITLNAPTSKSIVIPLLTNNLNATEILVNRYTVEDIMINTDFYHKQYERVIK
jgi:hypothetical protein